jgi:fructokinase
MYVVLGESLIDMVAGPHGDFSPVPGGGPYNFARALALQGIPTGYANPFSEDAFGKLLKRTLAASGATHLGSVSAKPTSLALVTTDEQGSPTYSFYREGVADRDLDASVLSQATPRDVIGFHTGALALVPPDHRRTLAALGRFRARGALCTLDVNMRPQIARSLGVSLQDYRAAALDAIASANIVKVSDEDLLNLGLGGDPVTEAHGLLDRGCDLVVLTLGAQGAWALNAAHRLYQPAGAVQLMDTVGAGDCFFAGFVASLHVQGALTTLHARPATAAVLVQAIAHASACAAINISRKGCQPPTWQEATDWLSSSA